VSVLVDRARHATRDLSRIAERTIALEEILEPSE
jgi:hypothetical protein